jgi:Fur family ferric uptake transcriptional regulator
MNKGVDISQDHVAVLLKRSQLSVTEGRRRILEVFMEAGIALSPHDIEEKTSERLDRVTVYRTLQTFLEKGIMHTIPTTDNSVLYALCKDSCGAGHHHDDHVHFVCEICGTTTCLDGLNIPFIALPDGYQVSQVNMVVNGRCRNCAA